MLDLVGGYSQCSLPGRPWDRSTGWLRDLGFTGRWVHNKTVLTLPDTWPQPVLLYVLAARLWICVHVFQIDRIVHSYGSFRIYSQTQHCQLHILIKWR